MTMPQETGSHSLWLIPERAAFEKLAEVIRLLAEQHGTPAFAPHVTLLSGLHLPEGEIEKRARTLASKFEPLQLPSGPIEWKPDFFRSLYLRIEPSERLLALFRETKRLFHARSPSFFPHLSLLYGQLSPKVKAAAASEVKGRCPSAITISALEVVQASSQNPVEAWRRLKAFHLRGTTSAA